MVWYGPTSETAWMQRRQKNWLKYTDFAEQKKIISRIYLNCSNYSSLFFKFFKFRCCSFCFIKRNLQLTLQVAAYFTFYLIVHFWKETFESRRTIYSYFDFGRKNSNFRLPYQRPTSSADCARELFKGSKESASLVDYNRKNIFWLGVRLFCDWRHKWSSFRVILSHVARPGAQPLGQSVSLKFSLETRLESESFEPLIDFLAFLVQKLWSKINKLNNYLIR